eukprot:g249.t1
MRRQDETNKSATTLVFAAATVVVIAALLFELTLDDDGSAGMEWKEVRIGVWVAKLGLMRPLYDFLAKYGPTINTMNYGVYDASLFDDDAALTAPLNELDRFSLNLYSLVLPEDVSKSDATLKILEVGSGRGGGLFHLQARHPKHEFVGVDLSAPAVEDATRRFGDLYKEGNALDLPIANCTQDAVINVESSHNYPDLAMFFAQVDRVLVGGGRMGYADIMATSVVEARAAIIRTSGLTIAKQENITPLVLASMESEQLNEQKHRFVQANYEELPWWIQAILPQRIFLNLAGVKGSPQHLHFRDGSESYMHFELVGSGRANTDAFVRSKLTVLITTSPVPSNPLTSMIEQVIESLSTVPHLAGCAMVIVCDGHNEHKANVWKAGKVTAEGAANYQLYLDNLAALVTAGKLGAQTSLVLLDGRHGQALAVKAGLDYVETELVLVHQHDLLFMVSFDLPAVLTALLSGEEEGAEEGARAEEDTEGAMEGAREFTGRCVKYVGMPLLTNVHYEQLTLSRHRVKVTPAELEVEVDVDVGANCGVDDETDKGTAAQKTGVDAEGGAAEQRVGAAEERMGNGCSCGIDSERQATTTRTKTTRRRGTRKLMLMPVIFWYDSTHITSVRHYRSLVFSSANPFRRGDFIEETFGHKQRHHIVSVHQQQGQRAAEAAQREYGTYHLMASDGAGRRVPVICHMNGNRYLTDEQRAAKFLQGGGQQRRSKGRGKNKNKGKKGQPKGKTVASLNPSRVMRAPRERRLKPVLDLVMRFAGDLSVAGVGHGVGPQQQQVTGDAQRQGLNQNDPNGPVFDPVHGVFHHFYQIHLAAAPGHGPDYGHFVSKDLVTWAQLPVAIWNGMDASVAPARKTPYDNEAIFTGSAVVVSGAGPDGQPGIVHIYPGLCNKNDWASCETGTLLAQAIPADYAGDELLVNWTKPLTNPVMENTERDPSGPWRTPSGEWRLRTYDSHVYGTASDADFLAGKWYEIGVSKDFRQCECPSFYPLPPASPGFEAEYEAAASAGALPTHVHKTSCGGDWWQVGTYKPGLPKALGSFAATPGWEDLFAQRRIDAGTFYASKDNVYPSKQQGQSRRLNWGWSQVPPQSCQSLPREITFNARARVLQQYPIEELLALRWDAAYSSENITISNGPMQLEGLRSGVTRQSEVVVSFELPEHASTFAVWVGDPHPPDRTLITTWMPNALMSGATYNTTQAANAKACDARCAADPKCEAWTFAGVGTPWSGQCYLKTRASCPLPHTNCTSGGKSEEALIGCPWKSADSGIKLTVEYAPPANASAPFYDVPVRATSKGPNFNDTLRILAGETSVELRVFSDATFVEAFWGRGRVAMTVPVQLNASSPLSIAATSETVVRSAEVFPLRGIWAAPEALLLLLLVAQGPARGGASYDYDNCVASTLGLTHMGSGFYCAQTEAQFNELAKCVKIDHWCVRNCPTCTQARMDSVKLTSISGKDPTYGHSLYIRDADAITSVAGLSGLSGALQGALEVGYNAKLRNLAGLGGVSSMGTNKYGWSINLYNNPELENVLALEGASYQAGTLYIPNNPKLVCAGVPSGWPEKTKDGRTIRAGTCAPTAAPTAAPTTYDYNNCVASTLGLTQYLSTGLYCVTTEAQFNELAKCVRIDHWCVRICPTCTQARMDSVQLTSISSKDPEHGYSLYMYDADAITSLAGLSGLSGALEGGLYVGGNAKLRNLAGLGG